MRPNNLRAPYMLEEHHFALMLIVAMLVHISAFVAWHFTPHPKVQDIPIRTMNIRLAESDDDDPQVTPQMPTPPNAPKVEAIVEQITRDAAMPKAPTPPKADEAKQYVREVNNPRMKKTGKLGKSGDSDTEIMSRYTQLASLWIRKFQRYPDDAHAAGQQGAVMVRIRIDRRGNIGYYALERSSGIPSLDRAALDMIRRANPVPAVPDDYPAGDTFEFLIPVNFSLK